MAEKIKVLEVLNSVGLGGIECIVRDLCRNIDRSKIDFEIAIMDGKALDQYETFRSMGIPFHVYPQLTVKTAPAFMAWWKNFFRERKGYYQVVHIHTFTTAALYMKYAKQSGAYVIVHSHSVIPKNATIKKKGRLVRYMLRQKLQDDRYIDCRMACGQMAGQAIFKNKPFQVLNNGINTERYRFDPGMRQKMKEQFGWKEELIIGHVGNGTGTKNQEFLLKVFCEIHKKQPDSRLLLIGELTRIESKLREYAEQENLTQAVSLLGVRSDVPDLMTAMDMFVFPSFFEGLPVVLVEAQCEGLYCVVSDAVSEEARISDWCTFYPLSQTAEQWANLVLQAWDKHKTFDRSQAWKAVVQANYDIKGSAKTLQDLYLTCKPKPWKRLPAQRS